MSENSCNSNFFSNHMLEHQRSKMVAVVCVLCYISYISAVVVGVDVSMELEMT